MSYRPTAKFARLGEAALAELDMREFPDRIEAALAHAIDALERRLGVALVVYRPNAVKGGRQLCQCVDSAALDDGSVREIQALECRFGLWIVAYVPVP